MYILYNGDIVAKKYKSIRVSEGTHALLSLRGNKGDSFDDIIAEMLCESQQNKMTVDEYIEEARKAKYDEAVKVARLESTGGSLQ